jgi:hypothetical protein
MISRSIEWSIELKKILILIQKHFPLLSLTWPFLLAAANVFELLLMLSKKNKTHFTIDASYSKTALGIRFFWLWSNYITHTHAHNKTLYHGSCRRRQETKRAQREFLKKKGETGYKGENNGEVFSSY